MSQQEEVESSTLVSWPVDDANHHFGQRVKPAPGDGRVGNIWSELTNDSLSSFIPSRWLSFVPSPFFPFLFTSRGLEIETRTNRARVPTPQIRPLTLYCPRPGVHWVAVGAAPGEPFPKMLSN